MHGHPVLCRMKASCSRQVQELACVYLASEHCAERNPVVRNVTEGHNTPKFYTQRKKRECVVREETWGR